LGAEAWAKVRITVLPMPTFSFKAAPTEAKSIRAAARASHLSVSEYLRRAALPRSTGKKPVTGSLTPGRVVIEGSADAPVLTSADVASALYD
jgi:hypothetical protein